MRLQHLKLIIPLIYMLIIYGLSSVPDTAGPETTLQTTIHWMAPLIQNAFHIPLFGGLFIAWYWALGSISIGCKSRSWLSFVIAVLYSGFDEWYQLSVPGRYGSVTDLLLDVSGILIAQLLISFWFSRKSLSSKPLHL